MKDRLVAKLKQQKVQQIFQSRAEELRGKAKVEVYIWYAITPGKDG